MSKRRTGEIKPHRVDCPACGAPTGEPCTSLDNGWAMPTKTHRERQLKQKGIPILEANSVYHVEVNFRYPAPSPAEAYRAQQRERARRRQGK